MEVKIVVGAPGAGKSTHLAKLAQSLPPNDTLILSYSKSAALSIAAKAGPKYKASTIHAECFRNLDAVPQQMLRGRQIDEFCHSIGVEPPNSGYDQYSPTSHFMDLYTYAKTTGEDLYGIYFKYKGLVNFTFNEYVAFVQSLLKYKDSYGLYEFNDLLELFRPEEAPANLLIDEAQDNSFTLNEAIKKLVVKGVKKMWLCGDPNQSIYTYSGADPKHMYDFGGTEHFLKQSYRCPPAIVDKAKTLFPDAKFDPTKEEGSVESSITIPENPSVILVRTNYIRHKIMRMLDLPPNMVMTFHRSKGLQWDHVVIMNTTTRKVRESMEIDPLAEKRVIYVAITRTKEKLTIVEGKGHNVWF